MTVTKAVLRLKFSDINFAPGRSTRSEKRFSYMELWNSWVYFSNGFSPLKINICKTSYKIYQCHNIHDMFIFFHIPKRLLLQLGYKILHNKNISGEVSENNLMTAYQVTLTHNLLG